jgi:hypothetical protein
MLPLAEQMSVADGVVSHQCGESNFGSMIGIGRATRLIAVKQNPAQVLVTITE